MNNNQNKITIHHWQLLQPNLTAKNNNQIIQTNLIKIKLFTCNEDINSLLWKIESAEDYCQMIIKNNNAIS